MMGFNMTPMVKNLLILNIGLFVIVQLLDPNWTSILGLKYINAPTFAPWQIITHMFMHADFMHLLSNMFMLFMFGPNIEQVLGPKRFLLFYMICGVGAAFLHSTITYFEIQQLEQAYNAYIADPSFDNLISFARKFGEDYFSREGLENYEDNPSTAMVQQSMAYVKDLFYQRINVPMVGASGAIFGVLLGFGMIFPNMMLMLLIPPIPIKAKYLVLIFGLMEFFYGVQPTPGDNIAHFAHLGGMLFAFILIRYWAIYPRH